MDPIFLTFLWKPFFYAFIINAIAVIVAYLLVKNEAYTTFSPIICGVVSFFLIPFFYLFFTSSSIFWLYIVFSGALAITAHTDAQTLLISRLVTLFLIPLAWFGANVGWLPISPLHSIGGALLGLLVLHATARISHKLSGQESLGQGDIDLLAFIGAVFGPFGCWYSLLFGSVMGSLFGIGCMIIKGKPSYSMRLPFGTFLVFGALFTLLIQLHIIPPILF